MQKNIRFFHAHGEVINVPVKKIENYEIMPSGERCRTRDIVTKYETRPDMSYRETLEVFEEDIPVLNSALAWRTEQGDINITTQNYEINAQGSSIPIEPEKQENVIRIPVYGRFEPPISKDEIHEICSDYRLLHPYFTSFNDVFSLQIGRNKFENAVLEFLIQAIEQTGELVVSMGKTKNAEPLVPKIPKWIKRVMEIRKQYKQ